jgi:hypothetical protein
VSNQQKVPLARTLSKFATQKALDEIAKRGTSLPGHVTAVTGSIVTVNFDVAGVLLPKVTMPLFGPEYIRYPIQVGDKGVAFPASVSIVGVSGLGTAPTAADFQILPGNLSTLVWYPIANKNWAVPPGSDANTLLLYGKLALLLLDSIAGNASVKLTGSNIVLTFGHSVVTINDSSITLTSNGKSVVINSSGITLDGILWETHAHSPGTYVAGTTPVTGEAGSPQSP